MPRNFAHLLSFGRQAAAARAEETEEERKKREEEEEEKARKEAEEAEEERKKREEEEEEKAKKAKKAKAQEGETEEERKKREEEEEKAKKAKGKTASDGDEEDEEDEADMKARSARARERARCAAIFDSPYAAANLVGACHLAFGTSLPRSQAISMLAATARVVATTPTATAPRRDALRDRMAVEPSANVGSGAPPAPTGAAGLAAQIVAAGKKRRGEI